MLNYKDLIFAGPTTVELDIADVLTSVGVQVSIGETVIKWAHDIGDLGGEPEGLDCTPLSSKVHLEKSGVENQEKWTVDYFFNDEDYSFLETQKAAKTSQEIKVTFDDGTSFTNKGVVSANYLSGQTVNNVSDAHAVIELSGEWKYNKAAAA